MKNQKPATQLTLQMYYKPIPWLITSNAANKKAIHLTKGSETKKIEKPNQPTIKIEYYYKLPLEWVK